jgi:hypothetical protein
MKNSKMGRNPFNKEAPAPEAAPIRANSQAAKSKRVAKPKRMKKQKKPTPLENRIAILAARGIMTGIRGLGWIKGRL